MLEFNEEKHEYTLNGKKLISVTQLMQKHGLAPSYAGVSTEVLNAKAERGTLIHKEIEDFNKSGAIGFTKEMLQFKEYISQGHIEVEVSECRVNNDIVAGTIDLVLKDGEQPIIADIKTTYTLHQEAVSWQLSIYLYLYHINQGKEAFDLYEGQAFHFNKDGDLNVVDIPLKPYEEIEKLMECERKGEVYKYEVDFSNVDISEIASLEQIIKDLDAQVKDAKSKQEKLKSALLKEMESRNLKTYEKGGLRITYVAPSSKTTFDTKLLKEKYPTIYEKCSKTTETKASLRITLKEKKDD